MMATMSGHATEARWREWLREPLFWVLAPALLILLIVLLLIAVYFVLDYFYEVQADRQREAIGSFVAPTDWEELVDPRYSGEFGDSFCMLPALFCNRHKIRRWMTTEPQTGTALRAAAQASGWKEMRFAAESYKAGACREEGEGSYWCPLHAVSGRVRFELHTWPNRNAEDRWWVRLRAY